MQLIDCVDQMYVNACDGSVDAGFDKTALIDIVDDVKLPEGFILPPLTSDDAGEVGGVLYYMSVDPPLLCQSLDLGALGKMPGAFITPQLNKCTAIMQHFFTELVQTHDSCKIAPLMIDIRDLRWVFYYGLKT